MKKISTSILL